jgi:hypothetical protein
VGTPIWWVHTRRCICRKINVRRLTWAPYLIIALIALEISGNGIGRRDIKRWNIVKPRNSEPTLMSHQLSLPIFLTKCLTTRIIFEKANTQLIKITGLHIITQYSDPAPRQV